jgi:hypothetical protein
MCDYCGETFGQGRLHAHADRCPARPALCRLCGTLVRHRDHSSHVAVCGTFRCGLCSKELRHGTLVEFKRERSLHALVCVGKGRRCKHCGKAVGALGVGTDAAGRARGETSAVASVIGGSPGAAWIDPSDAEAMDEQERRNRAALELHESAECEMRPVPCPHIECPRTARARSVDRHAGRCRHRPVVCDSCGQTMSESRLRTHAPRCPERTAGCRHCDEPVRGAEKLAHEAECPKRPTICDACGRSTTHENLLAHMDSCDERRVACDFCGKVMRVTERAEHTAACGHAPVPCAHCAEVMPGTEIPAHHKTCAKFPVACQFCGKPGEPGDGEPAGAAMFPRAELPAHVAVCDAAPVACDHCGSAGIPRGGMALHVASCARAPVPCEHCKAPFPRDAVQVHAETCDQRPAECDFCSATITVAGREDHWRTECERAPRLCPNEGCGEWS